MGAHRVSPQPTPPLENPTAPTILLAEKRPVPYLIQVSLSYHVEESLGTSWNVGRQISLSAASPNSSQYRKSLAPHWTPHQTFQTAKPPYHSNTTARGPCGHICNHETPPKFHSIVSSVGSQQIRWENCKKKQSSLMSLNNNTECSISN